MINIINSQELTWDKTKNSANALLRHYSKKPDQVDLVKDVYDDQLYIALKDIAVKQFVEPDAYIGLDKDLAIVKMGIIIFNGKGFIPN